MTAPLIPPVGEDDPLVEALASIRALRPPCDKHKPLRFPMCGACQFDARLEEADDVITLTRQQIAEKDRDIETLKAMSSDREHAERERAEAAESREAALRAEVETWEHRARKVLWLRHGCPPGSVYGDDGEMQCGGVGNHPGVWDFKRTPWEEIEAAFLRGLALKQEQATPCVWTEDRDGQWDTACGRTWEFLNDGPTENRMHFCHGCGHPVTAVHYIDTVTDDDDESEPGPPTP